ncbi:hypothetical protein PG993_002628 [Apiospora rasikravindrae]|uniref:Uncharacterized protein n=1 Tax=Apiospora rasikravindrae TaxID=990691 RepID=A0ABR1TZT6_9PEZI
MCLTSWGRSIEPFRILPHFADQAENNAAAAAAAAASPPIATPGRRPSINFDLKGRLQKRLQEAARTQIRPGEGELVLKMISDGNELRR